VKLAGHVFSVKKRFLGMCKKAHAGHIGSSLSCAEILVFLRFAWMRDDDTFVLSKGHAVAALYSLLAEANVLTPSQIDSFYVEGTRFPALPPSNAVKEIPFATGSLGHGLSLCALGFQVFSVDGHDLESLLAVRNECSRVLGAKGTPVAIIAETIKGHGIRYMQDTVDSHYLPMDDAQYEQALAELTQAHQAALRNYRHAE
jgi:transketolase N-terminal domain/subunit